MDIIKFFTALAWVFGFGATVGAWIMRQPPHNNVETEAKSLAFYLVVAMLCVAWLLARYLPL